MRRLFRWLVGLFKRTPVVLDIGTTAHKCSPVISDIEVAADKHELKADVSAAVRDVHVVASTEMPIGRNGRRVMSAPRRSGRL